MTSRKITKKKLIDYRVNMSCIASQHAIRKHHHLLLTYLGGAAQWLGRRSLAGRLSLIYT